MHKVIVNKDGRAETVSDYSDEVAQARVQRTRRELRDMIDGNTSFHVDPLGRPVTVPDAQDDDSALGVCCSPGFDRYESIFGKLHYA